MPGVVPRFQHAVSPTYTAGAFIVGGMLVEGTDTGTVVPATAASTRVLGVASKDARPGPRAGVTTTNADGFPQFDSSMITDEVAIWKVGEFGLTFAANARFGQRLVAAANGQVTPAPAGAPADQIVGTCTEPGGVVANAKGLARLGL